MSKIVLLASLFFLTISCQKKNLDDRSRDEVLIEFATRLEEHSPEYQYDHSQKPHPAPKN